MPLRPVPEGAVRRVEMLAAVTALHERVTLKDKGGCGLACWFELPSLPACLLAGDGRVFLKPVDLKLLPVGQSYGSHMAVMPGSHMAVMPGGGSLP